MRQLLNSSSRFLDATDVPLTRKKDKGDAKSDQAKNEVVRKHYQEVFKKEVDFHHKVAYRFEKAYRLGKQMPDKRHSLNLDIIECISEHSGYVEQD